MEIIENLKIQENTPREETERLILRKFTPDDVEAVFRIYHDKEVNTFLPMIPLETLAEAAHFLQVFYLESYRRPVGYRYAICLKTDDVPVGYVQVNVESDSFDFGYALRKEFWHQGITTEAGKTVVERLKKAGYPMITATHDVNNPRSGAVMKKLGMKYCYSYREQWQPKNIPVTFRMFQLNLDGNEGRAYQRYWEQYPHFIEELD